MMRDQQRWAYCDVRPDGTITYYGIAEGHRIQARPNVHAVDTNRWVEEAVAWLGWQGWELVSVVHGEGRTFYFRRPIAEHTAEVEAQNIGMEAVSLAVAEEDLVLDADADARSINPARLIEEEFLPE
ncbi:MAG TPA: hypothetical protein VGR29_11730 [Thermomicrobiales bacterium]|nr:hypothetical protein [Thermomicrobiales bacterium]